MDNFNRDRNPRDNRRGGYGRSRNTRSRRDFGKSNKQMFRVVCSNCGKDCEVPFRPTSDKPVYCSDCFEKMGGRESRKSFDRTRRGGGSYSDDKYKAQFESLNAKMDKIIDLLQTRVNYDRPALVEPAAKKTKTGKSKTKTSKKEDTPEEIEQTS